MQKQVGNSGNYRVTANISSLTWTKLSNKIILFLICQVRLLNISVPSQTFSMYDPHSFALQAHSHSHSHTTVLKRMIHYMRPLGVTTNQTQ